MKYQASYVLLKGTGFEAFQLVMIVCNFQLLGGHCMIVEILYCGLFLLVLASGRQNPPVHCPPLLPELL
jgi:hypothetical protein